jgi:tRNA/tmRNA/rRNA uracil-C5-methylase (TrmA/RlmC/RlmD family)
MPASDLEHLINQLEADTSLREPEQLRARFDALDTLDTYFAEFNENNPEIASIHTRSNAIRSSLEAVNAALYESMRLQIQHGAQSNSLLDRLQKVSGHTENGLPLPGLGYDYQEELLSGVLALREPAHADAPAEPEMVFYQPTPVRHILRLIDLTALAAADVHADVLVDLGSGLGHVPLLASILTGARSLGIEVEPAYVACARECAERLRLTRVTFVQQDARTADLSTGTVFHLYTPFTGAMLAQVLERLRRESESRPIRISTLGPCTQQVAALPWLQSTTPPDPDQITLFQSRS